MNVLISRDHLWAEHTIRCFRNPPPNRRGRAHHRCRGIVGRSCGDQCGHLHFIIREQLCHQLAHNGHHKIIQMHATTMLPPPLGSLGEVFAEKVHVFYADFVAVAGGVGVSGVEVVLVYTVCHNRK